ncbi:MAG: UDP-N-acetylmuramate dehydrogenase [Candidatus Paceibacterota bacterium]
MKEEVITNNLNVEENVSFEKLTTFKIGGPARFLFKADFKQKIPKAIRTAQEANVPYFLLGNGSNLLVTDDGYDGLVVRMDNTHHEAKGDEIKAGAGMDLQDLVDFALEQELKDLEWAAGIPGTLGGAIRGNAGAFGLEMEDIVKEVEVYNTKKDEIETYSNKKCDFNYRQSIFKQNPELIILEAVLVLNESSKKHIKKKMEEHIKYREQHHPLSYPCSGSVFQNLKTKIKDEELLSQYSELGKFNEQELIPAGWLVEKTGLQGKKVGDAKISDKHSNFIVNLGGAKAQDVMEIINLVREKVKEKFGIKLQLEIETLGF